ncbi:unnamed protein product, partial [Meganyctiphanes norvegica]
VLLQLLNRRKVYGKKIVDGKQYYSLLYRNQGCLYIRELQEDTCPEETSLELEFGDLLQLSTTPTNVYIIMSHENTELGTLHIRFDGWAHRWCDQFTGLVSGVSGNGSYRGSGFSRVWNKGAPGEHVWCMDYMSRAGVRSHSLVQKVEGMGEGGNSV